MVTLATADAYFGATKHVLSSVWLGFDVRQRTAGLFQANELITRHLGVEPQDDATTITDRPRPDRAVYEQALYMLRSTPGIANGAMNGPKFVGGQPNDPSVPVEGADPYAICDEAQRWLQWPTGDARTGARITMMRG
jgi:hypothetical protein